jgi:hypothetical protein
MRLGHGCEKPMILNPDILSTLELEFDPAEDSDSA